MYSCLMGQLSPRQATSNIDDASHIEATLHIEAVTKSEATSQAEAASHFGIAKVA